MTNINPVRDEASHEAALARIDALMDAGFGSPEGDELDILTTLVAAYEEAQFPMDIPSAADAIRFVMEQRGLQQRDFAALVGRNRASEILHGVRPLSFNQARTLFREWHVPAEALLAG